MGDGSGAGMTNGVGAAPFRCPTVGAHKRRPYGWLFERTAPVAAPVPRPTVGTGSGSGKTKGGVAAPAPRPHRAPTRDARTGGCLREQRRLPRPSRAPPWVPDRGPARRGWVSEVCRGGEGGCGMGGSDPSASLRMTCGVAQDDMLKVGGGWHVGSQGWGGGRCARGARGRVVTRCRQGRGWTRFRGRGGPLACP